MPLDLAALQDRAELTDLVSRLGRWLDGGALGDPALVLTDDVRVSTPGGVAEGLEAAAAQARRAHAVPTQHVISDVLADVNGDHATVSANLVVTFVRPEGLDTIGERYAFTATRTAAGWRLSSVGGAQIWRTPGVAHA